MKKKILSSLATILLGAALVGGATFAEFTSAGVGTGNTFTAGTLHMHMDGNDNTSATWVSDANWAPGQTVDGDIEFTNTGSVNANHVYFGFKDVIHNGNGDTSNLMDVINVTELKEDFGTGYGTNQAAWIDSQVGNPKDGKLTLREFSDWMQNNYGYYTWAPSGSILQANSANSYKLKFTFQFDPNAGNEYQGDTAGFTLMARANQNSPTDGFIALHE